MSPLLASPVGKGQRPETMCLDAQNRIHAAKIDIKADASQVILGVFSVAVIHFIFENFVFKVRSGVLSLKNDEL